MKNYSVTFKSLRAGTVYTVHIGGGTGAEVPLKGGAQPFTTQEDDDEDMFAPIRTQSGYLRIIDDGFAEDGVTPFDWKDLIPQKGNDRPVSMTHPEGNNQILDWVGFLQPQSFSGELYGGTQEREYPVMCQLSALGGLNVYQSNDIVNIGKLLFELLDRLGHDMWRYVYFQGIDAVSDWLFGQATMMNYGIENDDAISCLQALEDICLFFGWTLRTHGNDLWFTSADDIDINWTFERINFLDLYDIEQAQPVNVSWSPFNVSEFVNTNNDETYKMGYHKVIANADINYHDNILELPMSEIKPLFDGKPVSHTSQGDKHFFIVEYYPTEYENNILSIDCYWDQEYTMGRFTASDTYEGDISDKHNYNFKYYLVCIGRNVPFNEYCFRLVSKFPMIFNGGMFTIEGNVNLVGTNNDQSGNGYIVAALNIGGLWWDGNSWGSQQSTFWIPVVGNKIADNRQLNGPYVAYNGFGVPVGNMGGLIEFRCLGSHSDGTVEGEACEFESLTFGFARLASSAPNNDNKENVYTATNESRFPEEKEIDLAWATDNGNSQGYAILMGRGGGYLVNLSYTNASQQGSGERPEQHLVNRMAYYYGVNRHRIDVNLDTDDIGNVSPGSKSGRFYPLSIGHEWRDDITSLTLIEL